MSLSGNGPPQDHYLPDIIWVVDHFQHSSNSDIVMFLCVCVCCVVKDWGRDGGGGSGRGFARTETYAVLKYPGTNDHVVRN